MELDGPVSSQAGLVREPIYFNDSVSKKKQRVLKILTKHQ